MAITQRSQDAVLLALQALIGVPRSSVLATTTDPANPPKRVADLLDHFFEGVYDLRPESHLSRFLKALLGDAGIGSLRKRYAVARQSSILATTRYTDLDKFYGSLLGFARLSREVLAVSPYLTATPDQWDQIEARDASYRARVEQFSRALPLGATKAGMAAAASALLGGIEVRVYESYLWLDQGALVPGGSDPLATGNSYGDEETDYATYGDMEVGSYADLEGGVGGFGRAGGTNRGEFIVRPKRGITAEETYELVKVLTRLKPAQALLTVEPQGVGVHRPVFLSRVAADSTYWEVAQKLAPRVDVVAAYPLFNDSGVPSAQPRPAFSAYQGEAWAYNADVVSYSSYAESPDGNVMARYNYDRIEANGKIVDYTPDRAMGDATAILLGRYASDGVLAASPYNPSRAAA